MIWLFKKQELQVKKMRTNLLKQLNLNEFDRQTTKDGNEIVKKDLQELVTQLKELKNELEKTRN
jgi:hypothetical protein